MANDDDKNIRTAIGELIATAQPAAKVYPWNALSHKITEWPGLFPKETRHGWVIKRSAESADRKNATRDKKHETYDVLGFYKFVTGKLGDNSDDEFSEICSSVYDAIKAEPRLDLDLVEYHELLQFVLITTIKCGEETLHFAQGKLEVTLCC